jgi:hypothetical protein
VDDAFVMKLTFAESVDDLLVVAGRWVPTGRGTTWTTATAPAHLHRAAGGDDHDDEWQLEWQDR